MEVQAACGRLRAVICKALKPLCGRLNAGGAGGHA